MSSWSMEKQRVCKICSKRFSNGKAMGGHMRSHLIKLPLHPNPKRIPIPMPMPVPIHPHPFPSSPPPHYSDRESETDDSPPKRRRSMKRQHRDDRTVEHAALSLVMMSRDRWRTEKSKKSPDKEKDFTFEDRDGDEEEEDSLIWKFKCKTCKKSFRSYQALGGHKASHKKIREDSVHQKVFQCPFCPKVFESGQALGGHKKVHFFKKISHSHYSPNKFGKKSIDLNRPAPAYDYDYDDEDEDEVGKVSEIEFSAISNPC